MANAFAPLHGGETSRQQWDGIINRSKYAKAAALVDLAEHGSGVPEEVLEAPNYYVIASKIYIIFVRFDIIWTLNYFALIAVQFFEQPLWCSSVTEDSCGNRDYYYLGELPYLTRVEFLAFEGVTLIILMVHTLFPIMYQGGMILYWGNHVNKLKVISLLFLTVALVVDILSPSPVAIYSLPRRIAPYIRVAFLILNIRGLRDNLVVLGGMVGTYINVLVLWLLFLLFSSWLAYVIYEDTQQGTTFFLSYSATLYQMFVLFITSNNPDVWIPAYKSSRWSSLFFILYVLLGVYFVTNLVLAVIYDSFKLESNGGLDKEQCIRLFEELKNYRRLPTISTEEFELIFNFLDKNRDDKEPWLEKFAFYNSSRSRTLKNFVKSPMFGYVVAVVLLLNLSTVITETTLKIQNNSGQKVLQKVEFVFGWIYVLEMALKVYTYGFENFWKDGQNKFDFIITWVIVIGETATLVSPNGLRFISNGECIRYLLIARMLRLIRLLMHAQRYRILIATFLSLIPSLMPYLGTVFCVMCIYCILGIQVFGGIVNAGNTDLQATDLAGSDYLLFNFKDYPSGMVTLFNLLVMGNWQIWMQIVAFVLEAFFTKTEFEAYEEEGEQLIRGRRTMGIKTRNHKVDMLLRHMLSSELRHSPPSP